MVDELAFLTTYAPKDVKAKVAAALQVLLSQGHAVGYSVVAASQDPRKRRAPVPRPVHLPYRLAPG